MPVAQIECYTRQVLHMARSPDVDNDWRTCKLSPSYVSIKFGSREISKGPENALSSGFLISQVRLSSEPGLLRGIRLELATSS